MWSNRDDHRYSKHCQCPSAWPLERCPLSYTTHSAESNIANGIYGPLLQLNLTFSVGHTEWQRKNRKKNNNRRKCRELVLKHHVAVGNCTRSATPWNACVNTKIAMWEYICAHWRLFNVGYVAVLFFCCCYFDSVLLFVLLVSILTFFYDFIARRVDGIAHWCLRTHTHRHQPTIVNALDCIANRVQ